MNFTTTSPGRSQIPKPLGPFQIVGAGPAGLACAIVLARAGWDVVVNEARKTAGGRFHDDFQGLENWTSDLDVLEELGSAGIERTFEHTAVSSGKAFDAWGNAYEIESSEPLYYLVRRGRSPGTLDHGLLSQAQDLGVDVRFDQKVHQIEGPAVLAGGPRSADAIAVGYVFDTDMEDGNWICFNQELAPLGYAYLLVSTGRGTIASCMFTDFKQQQTYLERTVEFFQRHAGLNMRNARFFGGYGNFRMPRTAVQGNKLVVGEHAGFQDSLAGFGMTYALRSGIVAARSLLEDIDYETLWQLELLPLLRTSISNRYLFNLIGDRGRAWAVGRYISKRDARIAVGRVYRPSALTRLIFPLALWRYRAPLKDKSCDHVNCGCVWCEHGAMSDVADAA